MCNMLRQYLVLRLAVALVALPMLAPLAGCSKDNLVSPVVTTEQVSTDSTVSLVLDSPLTLAEAGAFTRVNNLVPLEVRLERPGYVSGYILNGKTLEDADAELTNEHRKFLMFLSSHNEPEFATQRAAAVLELSRLRIGSLRINAITVTGTTTRVKGISGARVSSMPLSTNDPGPAVNPATLKPRVEPNSINHPAQMWAPYGGSSEVNKSYTYQRFVFNSVSAFWPSDATYEHETHIWDKSYANKTGYWVTNLPYAYLDCGNQTDSVDNFAVGSYLANQIRPYVWYYTYIGLTGQSSSSSTVTVFAQRGQRYGWNCWLVWSRESAGPLIRHVAPSGISWQF